MVDLELHGIEIEYNSTLWSCPFRQNFIEPVYEIQLMIFMTCAAGSATSIWMRGVVILLLSAAAEGGHGMQAASGWLGW